MKPEREQIDRVRIIEGARERDGYLKAALNVRCPSPGTRSSNIIPPLSLAMKQYEFMGEILRSFGPFSSYWLGLVSLPRMETTPFLSSAKP